MTYICQGKGRDFLTCAANNGKTTDPEDIRQLIEKAQLKGKRFILAPAEFL
jgi:hypothetical protein